MPAQIDIRGKIFNVGDIENFSIDWDKESKVTHLSVTLFDGQVFDFIEDDVQKPWEGELCAAKRLYEKLTGG